MRKRYIFRKFFVLLIVFLTIGFPAKGSSQGDQLNSFDENTENLEEEAYSGPEIIVNIPARKMYLFDEGDLVMSFPVAVGTTRHPTPVGMRKMSHWVWNPWWIPPKTSSWAKNSKDTPPGPRNPLGKVKMKLGGAIMMHGTNKEYTVGTVASHGCMRMFNKDAETVAKYLQTRLTDKADEDTFAKYKKFSRRSFSVRPENPIPVNIVYELATIQDGNLNLFKDVYYKVSKKIEHVEDILMDEGYDLSKMDRSFLNTMIKKAQKEKELSIPVDYLFMSAKKRQKIMEKESLAAVEKEATISLNEY